MLGGVLLPLRAARDSSRSCLGDVDPPRIPLEGDTTQAPPARAGPTAARGLEGTPHTKSTSTPSPSALLLSGASPSSWLPSLEPSSSPQHGACRLQRGTAATEPARPWTTCSARCCNGWKKTSQASASESPPRQATTRTPLHPSTCLPRSAFSALFSARCGVHGEALVHKTCSRVGSSGLEPAATVPEYAQPPAGHSMPPAAAAATAAPEDGQQVLLGQLLLLLLLRLLLLLPPPLLAWPAPPAAAASATLGGGTNTAASVPDSSGLCLLAHGQRSPRRTSCICNLEKMASPLESRQL